MHLKNFLKAMNLECNILNEEITKVVRKQNEIIPNCVYFSFEEINKTNFEKIRNKGAYLIIGESLFYNNHYIRVDSIKKIYQQYLLWKYKNKLKSKCFIGVTGTCGKSTVATLLYRFLSQKKKTIYYGTDGIYTNNNYYEAVNTTPSMEEFFKYLDNQYYVIMEISSISFFEYRLFGIKFDYLILTNVYEDHLDYHKTREEYIASKMLILATNYKAKVFISKDVKDERFLRLNERTKYYGFNEEDLKIFNVNQQMLKMTFDVETKNDYYHVSTNLLGEYNVMNIAGVINVLVALKYKMSEIITFIDKTSMINGRYNVLQFEQKPIIIDYCHTASSYEVILTDVKKHYGDNLLVIYGAGGNRQNSKRKDYSRIVSLNAKKAIITNDNPRDEDEMKIAFELQEALSIPSEIILDRKDAIYKALTYIKEYSALVILGKGPEHYITKKGVKYYHSDVDIIKEYVK